MTDAPPRARRWQVPDAFVAALPLLASAFVGLLGWLVQRIVVERLIGDAGADSLLAAEANLSMSLLISLATVLAFLLTSTALLVLYRPVHQLGSRIGLASLSQEPVVLPPLGTAALRQVIDRYNELVAALARSQQELRERAEVSEGLSSLVLTQVPSGIIAVDSQGCVLRVNDAALQILGREREALIERPLTEALGEGHPLARAATRDLQRDEVTVDVAPRGQVLGVSSGAIHDAGGAMLGRVIVLADLTELRRLEAELQLKERLSSLGELAAGLAHEIRNPLGALRGFVEILDGRLAEPERARPLLAKITREADALAKVVGDFLDFARAAPPRKQPLELRALLEEACEVGQAAAGIEDIEFALRLDGAPAEVVADASQLRRALVNFVLNACQATGAGGHIAVGAERVEESLRLFVEDDGPGVPETLRGQLPAPFLSTKAGGTGLGLAVAHQIAEAHGGQLHIEEPGGGGARFVLELPLGTGT